MGVNQLATPRTVQGPIQRRAEATNNGELWQLSGNQEDAFGLSEGDKLRIKEFVSQAVAAINLANLGDCSWYDFKCRSERKKLQARSAPDLAPTSARSP